MSVRGKPVHNAHDGCIFIGFVEGACEVNSQEIVGLVRVREGEGSAC